MTVSLFTSRLLGAAVIRSFRSCNTFVGGVVRVYEVCALRIVHYTNGIELIHLFSEIMVDLFCYYCASRSAIIEALDG